MDQSFNEVLINAGYNGLDKENRPIYLIIGMRMPKDKAERNKLIKQLDQQFITNFPFKQFFLVYIHSKVKDDDLGYSFFRNLYRSSSQQLNRCASIPVISPSLGWKSHMFFTLCKELNFMKKKFNYIKNITYLEASSGIVLPPFVNQKLCTLYGTVAQTQEQLLLVQCQVQSKAFIGRYLHEYKMNEANVPVFLDEFIDYFQNRVDFLKSLGVFRISGSESQASELVKELAVENYNNLNKYPPDVISTVLKNTLNNLIEPIFPFEFYDIIKKMPENIPSGSLMNIFQKQILDLPEINRNTLKFVLIFLQIVSRYEETNKMGPLNLGTVFGPVFIRPKEVTFKDMQDMKLIGIHFGFLIKFVHQLFPDPNDTIDDGYDTRIIKSDYLPKHTVDN